MNERSLEVIDSGNRAELWDEFVRRDPSSTFCHQAGWKDVMKSVLGHDSLYLAAIDGAGKWCGVLPLVRVRTIIGHSLISIPFVNDGGPLGDDDARRVLVERAVSEARASGATLLELRSRRIDPGPVVPSNRKVGVHLALPSTVDELWKTTYRAKLRSQVRRPVKEGMTARDELTQIEPFYEIFSRNMRDLGTPVLPRAFFEKIASVFGERVVFACVYTREGKPAAAACCMMWRDEIEITWASSLRELNHLSGNMLLYNHVIEMAIRRGLRVFNFGRSTPGGATHRFKKQWSGVDVELPWPSWTKGEASNIATTDRPVFRIATAVWRRLPVAVANRVGPPLARLLP